MANWPLLFVAVLLLTGGVVATVMVPRQLRARRRLATATAQRADVSLSPQAAEAAHAAMVLRASALQPTRLATPPAPAPASIPDEGRHATGSVTVDELVSDSPTTRLPVIPARRRPVHVPHPERGHRAATPARPANAPTASDSGPHRARRGKVAEVAGSPLTTPR